MLKRREKLTVAAIVSREGMASRLPQLEALACSLAGDWEILIIAHGVSAAEMIGLTREVRELPDATLHILDEAATDEVAQLAALDMAIGDRILLADLDHLDAKTCRAMLTEAERGFEVVAGRPEDGAARAPVYRLLRGVFVRLYRAIGGVRIEHQLPRTWLYSRAAALHLLSRREADMLLRSTAIGDAFPGTTVPSGRPARPPVATGARRHPLWRAYKAFNFTGALPMRLVVMLCVVSAVLNVGYMGYALISRLLEADVHPGWTTLSLQISGMFLLISVILGIIAEHLIALDRAVNRRPRYVVLREVRSPLSKAWQARNVVEPG